jgi:hypothetical protein
MVKDHERIRAAKKLPRPSMTRSATRCDADDAPESLANHAASLRAGKAIGTPPIDDQSDKPSIITAAQRRPLPNP